MMVRGRSRTWTTLAWLLTLRTKSNVRRQARGTRAEARSAPRHLPVHCEFIGSFTCSRTSCVSHAKHISIPARHLATRLLYHLIFQSIPMSDDWGTRYAHDRTSPISPHIPQTPLTRRPPRRLPHHPRSSPRSPQSGKAKTRMMNPRFPLRLSALRPQLTMPRR